MAIPVYTLNTTCHFSYALPLRYMLLLQVDLIKGLMTVDVAARLTVDAALKHPWVCRVYCIHGVYVAYVYYVVWFIYMHGIYDMAYMNSGCECMYKNDTSTDV